MTQHTIEQMKAKNAKLAMRHLVQINRLLDDVREADDAEWRKIKVGCYLMILDMVHVNGKNGSLAEDDERMPVERYYDGIVWDAIMSAPKTPETAELDDYAATMDAASNRGGYG